MMRSEAKDFVIDNGELRTSKAIHDFKDPDELYKNLVEMIKTYHPSDDLQVIEKAYYTAKDAHKDQKRKSGEPYIIHPVCVGIILAELRMDKETIVAGLLHDVVEDTFMTSEDVTREFGEEVSLLVDGVTKLTQLNYEADKVEVQAENLRKMFLAMAKDIRVIIIKLADRLHNQRTMQYQPPHKQREKSTETLEIYAPIADRLGISKMKVELDDLAFRYLEPEMYAELQKDLKEDEETREKSIHSIIEQVKQNLIDAGIEATVDGRAKHLFSIYRKMLIQHKKLDQIYDLFAVRIIVEDEMTCYAALGVIHNLYKPVPKRFKDYISMPKPNNYQSLHTTVIGPEARPFEIQIRTYDMHLTDEYGIAAHWKYKANQYGETTAETEEKKMAWLRKILEWQQEMSDNKEFLELLKSDLDLFADYVYCFTKDGDVKNLPVDSTPIDFAYAVHSAIGNKMVGARVNGNLVNIDYKIQNGDRVEIITSQNSRGPSRDWLMLVKSSQAKNKINQWFKAQNKEENIKRGKELLVSYAKTHSVNLSELLMPEYMSAVEKRYGLLDWNSVLAAIGHGGLKEGQVITRLQHEYDRNHPKFATDEDILTAVENKKNEGESSSHAIIKSKSGIVVAGLDDISVRFSQCCSPVPGDEIIGYVTRGRGVSIHRSDCINIMNLTDTERKRIIPAVWAISDEKGSRELYRTELLLFANDRKGMMMDIARVFTENNIDIKSLNTSLSKREKVTIRIGFSIGSVDELTALKSKLRQIEGVWDIERSSN